MKNRLNSQIIIFGIVILGVFIYVAVFNLIDSNSSNNYYSKEKRVNAQIDNFYLENSKLVVITSGDIDSVCVKTTRSVPGKNNICWLKVENNAAKFSVYKYKSYYIWIRDKYGNIGDVVKYNYNYNDNKK